MAVARVDSADRRSRPCWPSMPSTHFSANATDVVLSRWIDCSRLRAISGMRTLSSNWPCMPPMVIAVSLPITCAQTCSTTSGSTGLTLPGMIEEPFCSSGRNDLADARPRARAHQREVLGDLGQRDRDDLQRAGQLDERVAVGLRLEAVQRRRDRLELRVLESCARTFSAKRGCVFRPVPVAVPPSGICPTCTSAASMRSRAERDLRGVAAELLPERRPARRPSGACGRT